MVYKGSEIVFFRIPCGIKRVMRAVMLTKLVFIVIF